MSIIKKVINQWKKLRLRPIRIFCMHHVCKYFDSTRMNKCDWMPIEEFQLKVLELKESGVEFISLSKAHRLLQLASSPFSFRLKHYAVMTFDDGNASLKEVLPWLKEQSIPVTLFINGKYLDGVSYRIRGTERYLSQDDLEKINFDLMEIGHHGWEHVDVTQMSSIEFEESIEKNRTMIENHPRYIPFWAYTWGRHSVQTDNILKKNNIIPVFIDGMKNYNDPTCIHRELLENYKIEK